MKDNILDLAEGKALWQQFFEIINRNGPRSLPPADFVEKLRKHIKEGNRIFLIKMNEEPRPIPDDQKGTIRMIDDAAGVHVKWDAVSSSLAVVPQADSFIVFADTHIVISADGHIYVIKCGKEQNHAVHADKECAEDPVWRYSINEGDSGGIVRAANKEEALRKLDAVYLHGTDLIRTSDISVWQVTDDDYYREEHPDVWECY